ncbi:hypothetical protein D1013_07000 [Euzebyella marina]|uniref:Uncharacterized protein n=1 Tax=Euzebyella marina TaxID=1761453 RepID=A0A3G2L4D2_9FLAO|nr:hypothetical protein [Euzebyella marina]AYN67132.1 hypothetical protein D1013_07000 [Euzebyella marina]MBG47258.1 hypothetical protein [Pseudozobellia sp.]|tara:strand:+ start:1205 stop:1846 length:642 start_codon:yes stop_codon:yes gene_type:complete
MMDELELLKKDWQKKDEHLPKLSFNEIHKMLWKKSSSIVKWIFTISILEFTVPHLLYLLPGMQDSIDIYDKLGIKNISTCLWVVGYAVTFYFIFLFYKRYREISTLDNAKNLMEKIIRTRKTVKYYIIFGLTFLFITCVMIIVGIYLNDHILEVFPTENPDVSEEKFKQIMLWAISIFSVLFIAFMGGIYFLLYGILLRKLNKNYKELKQLEV